MELRQAAGSGFGDGRRVFPSPPIAQVARGKREARLVLALELSEQEGAGSLQRNDTIAPFARAAEAS